MSALPLALLLTSFSHASERAAMLTDFGASEKTRASLERDIANRLSLFLKDAEDVQESLDHAVRAAEESCSAVRKTTEMRRESSRGLETLAARFKAHFETATKAAEKPCDGFALKKASAARATARPLEESFARKQNDSERLRVSAESLLASTEKLAEPYAPEIGRIAWLADQAAAIRSLLNEAEQRELAAKISLKEIERIAPGGAAVPVPLETKAAPLKAELLAALTRLDESRARLSCGASNDFFPVSAPDGAAFDGLLLRCSAEAKAALERDLAQAPLDALAAAAEESLYEEDRLKNLKRDLDEWARVRAREERRLAQQRRFARSMRPVKPATSSAGSGLKGPWLAWGFSEDADAVLRLRVADGASFDEDRSPYKRLLRPFPFRDERSAQAWVCERLSGILERPVIGRSAEFGGEVVGLDENLKCE